MTTLIKQTLYPPFYLTTFTLNGFNTLVQTTIDKIKEIFTDITNIHLKIACTLNDQEWYFSFEVFTTLEMDELVWLVEDNAVYVTQLDFTTQ